MAKQFLTVLTTNSVGTDKKPQMIKTYSFTTDDDDGTSITPSETVSNYEKLLSINSPSIDSANVEDDLSETGTKIKRRKQRRTHETEEKAENIDIPRKKPTWYKKIDWSKPILVVGSLIFLYVAWTRKDIWIPRLLTSNARIRRFAVLKDVEKADELTTSSTVSPSTTSAIVSDESTVDYAKKQGSIEENETYDNDDDDERNSEGISTENNENSAAFSSKSSGGQRINIRFRRSKMTFSKESKKKKHRHSQELPDDDDLEELDDMTTSKDITQNESISSSHSPPPKKSRREPIQHEHSKTTTALNHGIRLSTYDDIIDQLRKNLKSRSHDRDFLSTISKATGLNKEKLYRFIYKKDYKLLTLETFMSLLDTFNLMLLIVPK